MSGPGANQGGILQTSSCKLDLKEPYYRMSQPQVYPVAQEPPAQAQVSVCYVHLILGILHLYRSMYQHYNMYLYFLGAGLADTE